MGLKYDQHTDDIQMCTSLAVVLIAASAISNS